MLAEGGDARTRARDDAGAPRCPPRRASRRGARPARAAPPSSGSSSSGRCSQSSLLTGAGLAGAQLAALVRKELIRPHEAIEDTFRFRHMLIRDAAYERISEGAPLGAARALRRLARGQGRGVRRDRRLPPRAGVPLPARSSGRRASGRRHWPSGPRSGSPRRAGERTPAATCRRPSTLLERAVSCFRSTTGRALTSPAGLGRALTRGGSAGAGRRGLCGGSRARASRRGTAGSVADAHGRALPPPVPHRSERADSRRVAREVEDAISSFEELGDEAGARACAHLRGKLRFWRRRGGRCDRGPRAGGRATRAGVGDAAQEAESLD